MLAPAAIACRRNSAFGPAVLGSRLRMDFRGTGPANRTRFARWAARATCLRAADVPVHEQPSGDTSAALLESGELKPSAKTAGAC